MHLGYYPPILMYHHIDDVKALTDCDSVSFKTFELQLQFLKKNNYQVITFEDLCKNIHKGISKFKKTVVITFDDGFKDNLEAAKILKKYSFPASIFIIISSLNKEDFLSDHDINWLQNNSTIHFGSHTVSHFHLPHLSIHSQEVEIAHSRNIMKEKYGINTNILAYPLGGFTKETLNVVKRLGFIGACTTNRGYPETKSAHPYALRRIKMTENDNKSIHLLTKCSGYYNIFRKLKSPGVQHPSFTHPSLT
ncbi:MAG TPA: polysaccharide deacetylase family protein [Bdellovibrionota bacterium]|nr:polysaccharide deacetylase family protein [Bdellovibrionota bacterium]